MKVVTTYEYSYLSFEDVFEGEGNLDRLTKILDIRKDLEDKYKSQIEIGIDGLKFKQFVGVMKIGETLVEVLPKVFNVNAEKRLTKSEIYKNLNYIINKSNAENIKNIDTEKYGAESEGTFLDIYINMFLQKLYKTMYSGVYKTYNTREENLNYIRGKLLVADNIRINKFAHKMYCSFEEFTEDNIVNHVFKYVVKMMSRLSSTSQNKIIDQNILHEFQEVSDIKVNSSMMLRIKNDRTLSNYIDLLNIAKIFLDSNFYDLDNENANGNFIYTIDMNLVFQQYIFEVLKEYKTEIFGANTEILSQYSSKHLMFSDKGIGVFNLKPDILLFRDNEIAAIIDTKYKILDLLKVRKGVNDKDLYQMYGYYNKYGKKNVYLIYPMYNYEISDIYFFEKEIDDFLKIATIDFSQKLYSVEGEQRVVNSLKSIFYKEFSGFL